MLKRISETSVTASNDSNSPCSTSVSPHDLGGRGEEFEFFSEKPQCPPLSPLPALPSQAYGSLHGGLLQEESADLLHRDPLIARNGDHGTTVGVISGGDGRCSVKGEEICYNVAGDLKFRTASKGSLLGVWQSDDRHFCKCNSSTQQSGKALGSSISRGWGCVPSQEFLSAELRTFDLLTHLRTVARKWALHHDNFFFHWNRLLAEWRARHCYASLKRKTDGVKGDTGESLEAKVPGTQGSTDGEDRADPTDCDSVDTLCAFLPKLWNQNRPVVLGSQNPALIELLQQLDARRRAIDSGYMPLNCFLCVAFEGPLPASRSGPFPSVDDSCIRLSVEAASHLDQERERNGPIVVSPRYDGRTTPYPQKPLDESTGERGSGLLFTGLGKDLSDTACWSPDGEATAGRRGQPLAISTPAAATASIATGWSDKSLSCGVATTSGSLSGREAVSVSCGESSPCAPTPTTREVTSSSMWSGMARCLMPPAFTSSRPASSRDSSSCRRSSNSSNGNTSTTRSSSSSSSCEERPALTNWVRRRPNSHLCGRSSQRCITQRQPQLVLPPPQLQRPQLLETQLQQQQTQLPQQQEPEQLPLHQPQHQSQPGDIPRGGDFLCVGADCCCSLRCFMGCSKSAMNVCGTSSRSSQPENQENQNQVSGGEPLPVSCSPGALSMRTQGHFSPPLLCHSPLQFQRRHTWPEMSNVTEEPYVCVEEQQLDDPAGMTSTLNHSQPTLQQEQQQQQLLPKVDVPLGPTAAVRKESMVLCPPNSQGSVELRAEEQQRPQRQKGVQRHDQQQKKPQQFRLVVGGAAERLGTSKPLAGDPDLHTPNKWWAVEGKLAGDSSINGLPLLHSKGADKRPLPESLSDPVQGIEGCEDPHRSELVECQDQLVNPVGGCRSVRESGARTCKVARKANHIVVEEEGLSLSFIARKGVYYDKRRRLWRANWKENGRIHTKGFSVHDFRSHHAARQKAIEFRERKEQEIEIYQQGRSLKNVLEDELCLKG